MKVCEIFGNTIQGECHATIGLPMIFIRLSGCNLKCRMNTTKFNCDTDYHVKGKEMTVKQIIIEVSKINNLGKMRNVCITGGNPSISKSINMLINMLINNSYKVFIEDNGSVKFPSLYRYCTVVCSPKYYFNLKKWMFYEDNKPNYFKFVYTVDTHEQILNFIEKYKIPEDMISIMPEGRSRKELIENSERTVLFCYQHNLRFSPREHIMIWDKKRGV